MARRTPTTVDLAATILAQMEGELGDPSPLFPRALLRVMAKAYAGVAILLYKYIGWIGLQGFVRTASGEVVTLNGRELSPLGELGTLVGLGEPVAATHTVLTVRVNVESQVGSLADGSQLVGTANGVVYLTVGAVLLNAPTVTVSARAVGDAGAVGNLSVGAELSFANPLASVTREVAVVAQTTTGADAETVEHWRARVLARFQRRAQGGALADYEGWALGVAGVLNVYPYRGLPGRVSVYIESSTEVDGIPTMAQLDAVDTATQLSAGGRATRRPVGAWVDVLPITRTTFRVTVGGLTSPLLAQTRASVTEAVRGYFEDSAPFIVGLDVEPRLDGLSAVRLSSVVNDIVLSAGGTFSSASFRVGVGGRTLSAYSLGEGEKANAVVVYT